MRPRLRTTAQSRALLHDAYMDMMRRGQTDVGTVAIFVIERADGRYTYEMESENGDTCQFGKSFKDAFEARESASQAISDLTSVVQKRTTEQLLRSAASRFKAARRKQLEWIADHFDEIQGAR